MKKRGRPSHAIAEPLWGCPSRAAHSDFAQKLDRAGLEHAGANSLQHVIAVLPFQYDAVDAVSMEHMRQKQAGRTPADDGHLRSRRHLRRPLSQKGRRRRKVAVAQMRKPVLPRPSVFKPAPGRTLCRSRSASAATSRIDRNQPWLFATVVVKGSFGGMAVIEARCDRRPRRIVDCCGYEEVRRTSLVGTKRNCWAHTVFPELRADRPY